jgi:alpha-tubulin suppressor-like RCC1 family protein
MCGPNLRLLQTLPALVLLLAACDDPTGVGGSTVTITGRALMAESGSPVAGITLQAQSYRMVPSSYPGLYGRQVHSNRSTVSGADGRYSLEVRCPKEPPNYVTVTVFWPDPLTLHAIQQDGVADPIIHGGLERISCTAADQQVSADVLLKMPHQPPAPVASGLRFTSLSAGADATCGVTTSGDGYCWGYGILGDGVRRNHDWRGPSAPPVRVAGGHTFTAIGAASSGGVKCGITASGDAYCWGSDNLLGEIGDGSTARHLRLEPSLVTGGLTFRAIAVSHHQVCAMTPEGDVYCWGAALGVSGNVAVPRPRLVAGGLKFKAITAGGAHACGLTTTGAAYCWGAADDDRLGGHTGPSEVPVPVAGGLTFTALSGVARHTCGITTTGAAYCWGNNFHGQLGDGSAASASSGPVPVAGGLRFLSISAGFEHTCGVTTDSRVYCWGRNQERQVSMDSAVRVSRPVLVTSSLAFQSVTGGLYHTCAVSTDERAFCWGQNEAYLGTIP